MAQNMPSGPTRLGPEGYVAPTPRPSLALSSPNSPTLTQTSHAATDSGSMQQRTLPQLTLSREA